MQDKTSTVVLKLFQEANPSDFIDLLNRLSLSYVQQKNVKREEKEEVLYLVGFLEKKLVELYEARE